MDLNEVKIGDLVTFKNKQGKQVKGKVIHRHTAKDRPELLGHVNIQKVGGVPSYPVTIHVSQIKPVIEEEAHMDIKENIRVLLNAILEDNKVAASEAFNTIMEEKAGEALIEARAIVANNMFAEEVEEDLEEEEEYLTQDEFDALSDDEKEEWEAVELDEEQLVELSKKTLKSYVKKAQTNKEAMTKASERSRANVDKASEAGDREGAQINHDISKRQSAIAKKRGEGIAKAEKKLK